jgi:hypothetical protein
MDTADDGGEVAIADPGLAAARIGTKPSLGLAKIFERVAAKRADECLARALHGVLGMDSFEEQPNGAILGTGAFALLLDDGAKHVRILTVERMPEVTRSSGEDAQEGGDEQRGDVSREHGLLECRHGSGDVIEQVEYRR